MAALAAHVDRAHLDVHGAGPQGGQRAGRTADNVPTRQRCRARSTAGHRTGWPPRRPNRPRLPPASASSGDPLTAVADHRRSRVHEVTRDGQAHLAETDHTDSLHRCLLAAVQRQFVSVSRSPRESQPISCHLVELSPAMHGHRQPSSTSRSAPTDLSPADPLQPVSASRSAQPFSASPTYRHRALADPEADASRPPADVFSDTGPDNLRTGATLGDRADQPAVTDHAAGTYPPGPLIPGSLSCLKLYAVLEKESTLCGNQTVCRWTGVGDNRCHATDRSDS